MKRILGLDLGTNSIGWALVYTDFDTKQGSIEGLGSRIIPMNQDEIGKFEGGTSVSQTAERTGYRGVRRLNQRHLLRRERLLRTLHQLNCLPPHYAAAIDFEDRLGKFNDQSEVKLAYKKDENETYQFIFTNSFEEMLHEFWEKHPELAAKEQKIPYDWTIYYLRKKALSEKISKEELAWLLLSFNQKRGYYQLRGEDDQEDDKSKIVEYHSLKVVSVEKDPEPTKKDEAWYSVHLENGWIYRRSSRTNLDWVGLTKEFIVTTELDENGVVKRDKEGNEKRNFRAPKEDDWTLVKEKTQQNILKSNKTVGCYIYETLLDNPSVKINGKLVRTIERKFYKEELEAILDKQVALNSELQDTALYQQCINELYRYNETHKANICTKGFTHLLINDIIFYQRPLKSKRSEISDCPMEVKWYKVDGVPQKQAYKCTSRSHPLFQEFRLWQFLKNLKLHERDSDHNVTDQFLKTEEDWVNLFDWLNDKKEIDQKQLLAYPPFKIKVKDNRYRWNYVEDKKYPCNETRGEFLRRASKLDRFDPAFFTPTVTEELWHILYSVTDWQESQKAIATFAAKHGLSNEFVAAFAKHPAYEANYAAYSLKAIKRLLPLMRRGNYWDGTALSTNTLKRIAQIKERIAAVKERLESDKELKETQVIRELSDADVPQGMLKAFWGCEELDNALNTYQACYLIYGRHAEGTDTEQWTGPEDIDKFLKDFKQHSLRNPIVEKVITETLRVVRDIWHTYGKGAANFFDEIHIELGREMKNPAEIRKRMTEQVSLNENTNIRIKELLTELKNAGNNNIRPYSSSQQEILKIYEEGIYSNETRKEELDTIDKIRKSMRPSPSEIARYKLWLEQGYVSPYTGAIIQLGRLFSTDYQIEHIFPQSRLFDDSLSNKVICEAEVNALKCNMTAMEFIQKHQGEIVTLSGGRTVKIFEVESYEKHVEHYFGKVRTKKKNLLSADIPEGFINRQLNDSRYISKVVMGLLNKMVRAEANGQVEQEATSKNIIPLNGAITSRMKQDWGLNYVWNDLIAPRFERLNAMTNSNDYGQWELKEDDYGNKGKKVFQINIPDEIARGFSKKRIDHRHHALDALVIACVTRDHTNYLNHLNAKDENDKTVKHGLRNKLCFKEHRDKDNYQWSFFKPWETFTQDAKTSLSTTVVSFKKNTRVINKTVNRYQSWKNEDGTLRLDKNGQPKKDFIKQTKGDSWAIRKALHKETIYGKVSLRRIKEVPLSFNAALLQIDDIVDTRIRKAIKNKSLALGNDITNLKKHFKQHPLKIDDQEVEKVIVYETIEATAGRVTLDNSFDEKKIKKITDTGIQKILLSHLAKEQYQGQTDEKGKPIPAYELAFSDDGLRDLNDNMTRHKPIYKVRLYEEGNRFAVGTTGNKQDKLVEAAKGTNLFFAIYQSTDEERKRVFQTIGLNEVIESQKQGALEGKRPQDCSVSPKFIDPKTKQEHPLLFHLSPNDLVYVPNEEERQNPHTVDFANLTREQVSRVYKTVKFTGPYLFFIHNTIASSIVDKFEFSSSNTMEKSIEGVMIKGVCWKLEVDRLGKIQKVIR